MATLPYVSSPGNIDKAFTAIKAAAVPQRVTQDFVKTILKIPGGSGDQMTSFLKKLGFVNADGTPSEIYQKFRTPNASGAAMAKAIRHAYAPLYVRNEFMHSVDNAELVGLVMEETGQAHDSNAVKLVISCIEHLKQFADFEATTETGNQAPTPRPIDPVTPKSNEGVHSVRKMGLNLGYTINLNLPATSDPAVFDAIFKSLKENLLREEDG